MKTLVAIPVYNEEKNIPILVQELEETLNLLGKDYEIIFVDDGSDDATFELLNELFGEWENCRFVAHEQNQGLMAAIQTGIGIAKGFGWNPSGGTSDGQNTGGDTWYGGGGDGIWV